MICRCCCFKFLIILSCVRIHKPKVISDKRRKKRVRKVDFNKKVLVLTPDI